MRLEGTERQLCQPLVAKPQSPELELARALAREHDRFAIGPENGVEVDEDVVGQTTRRAALEQPKVTERSERRAPAVGRACDAVDALRLPYSRSIERR